MQKNKSPLHYIAIIIGIGLISFTSYLIFNDQLDLLSKKNKINYYAYNDSASAGNSIAKLFVDSGKKLELTYTLQKGFTYPYAGISVESPNETGFDFSSKNELFVKLSANKGTKIPISLMVFDSLYSTKDKTNSLLTFQYILNACPEQEGFQINFNQFSIPDWWYKEHHIKQVIPFSPSKHRISSINIENCQLLQTNVPDKIIIRSLDVQQKSTAHLYILGIGLLLFSVFVVQKWLTKNKTVRIEFAPSLSSDAAEDSSNSAMDFIGKQYHNPELSLADIKKSTGLTESKISEEIRIKTSLSFKQYLNAIRLQEAKNLLVNSQQSISEIAYQVGYNNVSHFNRVFKQNENCSPGDYRKKQNS